MGIITGCNNMGYKEKEDEVVNINGVARLDLFSCSVWEDKVRFYDYLKSMFQKFSDCIDGLISNLSYFTEITTNISILYLGAFLSIYHL